MRQTSVFGKRREAHTVIIARGDDIRHFTVRPWVLAVAGSAAAVLAISYLVATSYLVLRDDLIGSAVARQARMQQAYEDRIAALRAQVDRITSRQMLDQRLMEDKLTELMARQTQLTQRHGRLGPILEKTKDGERAGGVKPERQSLDTTRTGSIGPTTLAYAAEAGTAGGLSALFDAMPRSSIEESVADRADRAFSQITQSLKAIETEQVQRIRSITQEANRTSEQIGDTLKTASLPLDHVYLEDAGGPLIALDPAESFDAEMVNLDDALSRLDGLKGAVRQLPLASPAPGMSVSSTFGVRRDPILGIRAMHSGTDFRAPTGTAIRATAPGKVIHAGWNGGYGKMVEIEHANGFVTRFAHMSSIDVSEGERVDVGEVIGKVGSTGRSTGPHLHYEVRTSDGPLDPMRFLRTGRKIEKLL